MAERRSRPTRAHVFPSQRPIEGGERAYSLVRGQSKALTRGKKMPVVRCRNRTVLGPVSVAAMVASTKLKFLTARDEEGEEKQVNKTSRRTPWISKGLHHDIRCGAKP
eukprot:1176946-Prorocentrum_minimum.AAC.1